MSCLILLVTHGRKDLLLQDFWGMCNCTPLSMPVLNAVHRSLTDALSAFDAMSSATCCISSANLSQLALEYIRIFLRICCRLEGRKSNSTTGQSWSETPGTTLTKLISVGLLVSIRSNTLPSLVGSSTICVKPWSSRSSPNLWCRVGWLHVRTQLLGQSHPGKLKSPPISAVLFLPSLERDLPNCSRLASSPSCGL